MCILSYFYPFIPSLLNPLCTFPFTNPLLYTIFSYWLRFTKVTYNSEYQPFFLYNHEHLLSPCSHLICLSRKVLFPEMLEANTNQAEALYVNIKFGLKGA